MKGMAMMRDWADPSRVLCLAAAGWFLTLASAQAAGLSESDIVRQLQAPPTPSDDAVLNALASRQPDMSAKALSMPTREGLCSESRAASHDKNLEVIPIAPSGAPQVSLSLQFEYASYALTIADREQLDVLARALNRAELASARFTAAGHTDVTGDAAINLKLSCGRAESVVDYLVSRGVARSRLTAYGFGSAQLVRPSEPGAAINRRVEVRRAKE